MYFILKL